MPDLAAAFQAMQRRDYGAAHAVLGNPLTAPGQCAVPSEWWRIRALVCNAAGEVADAANAFEAGLAVLDREDGAASARLHASYGGFLINQERWWDAVEVFGHASHAARRSGDTLTRLSVAYNLAWAHLLTGEVDRAATAVEREVLAVGRPSGQSFGALILCARSLVALMRGDAALARSSALLAGRLAPTAELRARALYLRALAGMALGNAQGAREDLRASLQVYAGGDGGHRAAVMLALWEGQVPDVRSADDRAKVLLYHAAGALERGDQTGALDALQRGMATGSAYVAALCSILLPRLRDWSARSSSPLPAWTPPSRVIEVKVRGVLGVAVNGQRVHSRVPAGAAALLAALADADVGGTGERHALPAARVILEALGGRASELPRALHHARMLIGDADAVQETRMGEVPWLRLSESWSWMVDASGHGRILGGLDVPVAQTYT